MRRSPQPDAPWAATEVPRNSGQPPGARSPGLHWPPSSSRRGVARRLHGALGTSGRPGPGTHRTSCYRPTGTTFMPTLPPAWPHSALCTFAGPLRIMDDGSGRYPPAAEERARSWIKGHDAWPASSTNDTPLGSTWSSSTIAPPRHRRQSRRSPSGGELGSPDTVPGTTDQCSTTSEPHPFRSREQSRARAKSSDGWLTCTDAGVERLRPGAESGPLRRQIDRQVALTWAGAECSPAGGGHSGGSEGRTSAAGRHNCRSGGQC
jgi:hypothetical protein